MITGISNVCLSTYPPKQLRKAQVIRSPHLEIMIYNLG